MSFTKGVISKSSAPTVNDDSTKGFYVGFKWIETTNKVIYELVDNTATAAVWIDISVEELDGFIETLANKTYTLIQDAKYPFTINNLTAQTASGTITCKVQINGVDVTGITALAVTSTEGTATATAANTVAVGQKVTLVTSSNSTALDMGFTLKMTRNK